MRKDVKMKSQRFPARGAILALTYGAIGAACAMADEMAPVPEIQPGVLAGYLPRAQTDFVEIDQRQPARRRDRRLDIAKRATPVEKSRRRGAVEKPGVQMRQGVAASEPTRERAFA